MQGYGGPSLGWVTDEGDFLMEGSLFGAIPDVLVELHSVSDRCTSSQYGAERKSYEVSWVYPVEKRGGGDQIYDADDAQGLAGG